MLLYLKSIIQYLVMKKFPKIAYSLVSFILIWVLLNSNSSAHTQLFGYNEQLLEIDDLSWRVIVPSGYKLELLVEMKKPRMLTSVADGVLLAGSSVGNIYRIKPPYNKVEVIAEPGGFPHSVAVRNGELLVGMTDGVYRIPYEANSAKPLDDDDFELVAALPSGGSHSSRTVAVGPDSRIYLGLGVRGNCSDEYIGEGYSFTDQRGGILVLSESIDRPVQWKPYATGLRNPVGFDWHPSNGVLYASNNGPDHLGYELPREYFSRIDPGSFHGMPWFWLNERNQLQLDDCIDSPPPRSDAQLPVATFPARSAPMGVAFVPQGALQPEMVGSAIVAIHGSWGTKPRGSYFGSRATRRPPRLALVHFREDEASEVMPFIEDLQDDEGDRLARPMGVAFASDGALYFTSDGGIIEGLFRLRREVDKP